MKINFQNSLQIEIFYALKFKTICHSFEIWILTFGINLFGIHYFFLLSFKNCIYPSITF